MAGNKEGAILYKKVLRVIFTLLSIGMMLCGIVGLAVFSSDKYSQYEKNLLTSPDFYVFFLPIGLVVFFIAQHKAIIAFGKEQFQIRQNRSLERMIEKKKKEEENHKFNHKK